MSGETLAVLDRLEAGRVAGRWHTWEVNRTSYGFGVTLHYQGDLIGECALVLGRATMGAAADAAIALVPASGEGRSDG